MIIYLSEPGSVMKRDGGRFVVEKDDNVLAEIPLKQVEAVVIYNGTHVTSMVCEELLENGIPMTFVDAGSKFEGRLESVLHYNIERQAVQFERYQDRDFCLQVAKKIIHGKLNNSRVVLRRYNRELCNERVKQIIADMESYEEKISQSESIAQLCGYEGMFSKLYFEGLSKVVCEDFSFSGRSKRPPKDPLNSLLSFGYTLLVYEIYTSLTHKGLSPFVGFMHRLKNGHPALASDLMEEWRPLIVDSLVLKLVNGGTFKPADFELDSDSGGVYLNREDSKEFIKRFETRLLQTNNYIQEAQRPMTFRETLQYQINALTNTLEQTNPELYNAIIIR